MEIIAPATTANLGPGFDAVGLAVDLAFHARPAAADGGDGGHGVEASHPAARAFGSWGGQGPLVCSSPIPPGRGLGFSAAARVAGLAAAVVQRGEGLDDHRDEIFTRAAELEGHPDNAGPAAYGSLTVTAAGRAVRLVLGADVRVRAWVPARGTTSTDASRRALPPQVPFTDATFNVGRTALLVGALVSGDLGALGAATEDRLHQARRLDGTPSSVALATWREAGLPAWLSGSGPSVVALVPADAEVEDLQVLDARLPPGRVLDLGIDLGGVRLVADPPPGTPAR